MGFVDILSGPAATKFAIGKRGSLSVVDDFGADPTGAISSTVRLQAAINSAQGTTKALYFPPGTYVASGLRANASVIIELHSRATLILPTNAASQALLTATAGEFVLYGGRFNGNLANQAAGNPGNGLIDALFAQSVTIEDTNVRDAKGYGIRVLGSDVAVKGNRVFDTGFTGLYVVSQAPGTEQSGIRIESNHVDRRNAPVGYAGQCIAVHATLADTSNVFVNDNIVSAPLDAAFQYGMGIEVIGADTHRVRNVSIGNNVISGGGQSISLGGVEGATIQGNTCRDATGYGIEVAVGCRDVAVSGNTVLMGGAAFGSPIWVTNSERVNVTGNRLTAGVGSTSENNGIYLFTSSDVKIDSNQIKTQSAASATGIKLNTGTNVSIRNNDVTGQSTRGIEIYQPNGVHVSGNAISGSTTDGVLFWSGTGTYFFSARENQIAKASGADITRNLEASTLTGSTVHGNTSPTGVIADWAA